jgi:tetratricopeptide (TPR) repeat protein
MTEYGFVSGYNADFANQMRESLKRAIELNPNFTASYALLAFVNFVRNESLDESIGLIQSALKIASGNQKYQLRLAELKLRKEKFSEARKLTLQVLQNTENAGVKLYAQNTIQRIDATEYQMERIRNEKAKYVNDDIVTDKPLSEEEIRKLREKATNDQIRAVLRPPNADEKRVFGTLAKIECGKNKVNFVVKTATGLQRFYSNSLDGIILLSLVEEMSDYRLNCGVTVRENNAALIVKNGGEIVSIEFVPKGFK